MFTGTLYAGLMQTAEGTKVIEFNTRFGDPETQVIVDVMAGKDPALTWKDEACVGVVLASKGYPNEYTKGVALPENNATGDAFIIQAGTKQTDTGLVSNGGRVLLVGATGKNLNSARETAYANLKVYDENDAFFYRTDIGINN